MDNNLLFKNSTIYTQDTYFDFLRFHKKTYMFAYILYTIAWILLLLLCIYLSFGSNSPIQGILLILVLIGFVAYRVLRPRYMLNKELNSDNVSDENINTFNFYDSHFVLENNDGSFSYRYLMLHKIFETNDYFYLYTTKENAFILSKNTFSIGTPKEFSSFIKKHCLFKYKNKCH